MSKARLKDVTEFVLDGTHGSPVRTEAGVPVLSAQNVKGGRLDFETNRYTSVAEYDGFRKRFSLAVGDVLLTIVGTIGRAAVVDEIRPLVFQRSVAVVRPRHGYLCPRFLYHVSQSRKFQDQLSRASNQSSQAGVYLGKLKELEIPLPSLFEQQRIAAILDKADALRAKRRAALAHLDTLTQSIFLDMFGDPAANGWEMTTVANVAAESKGAIRTGPFGSQLLHSEFTDAGIAVLGIDNAVQNEFRWAARRFVSEAKYRQLAQYTVHPGDVLITIMGTCGRCAIVPNDIHAAINTKHLCCITLNRTKCLPVFLHGYFLRHPLARAYLARKAKGAIMDGLNMGIIKGMPIPLAPLELQQRFAQHLIAVNDVKAAHRASLTQLDALFVSLQHRAFRGEL